MKKNKDGRYDETEERSEYTRTEEGYTEEHTGYEDEEQYTSYTEQDENPEEEQMTGTEDDAEPKQKKKSQLPLIIGGVLILGGGFFGYNLFFKPHNQPQRVHSNPMVSNNSANTGNADQSQKPVTDNTGVNNTAQKSTIPSDIENSNAQNALPDLGNPVKPISNQVQQGQPQQGQAPQLGQPQQGQAPQLGQPQQGQAPQGQAPQLGQPQQGQAPQFGQPEQGQAPQLGQPEQGQAPQLGQPQQDQDTQPFGSVNSNSSNNSGKIDQAINQLIDKMDGFQDTMNKVSDSIDGIKKSDVEQDNKISSLETRISSLESKIDNIKTTTPTPVVVKESVKKPVVKKARVKKAIKRRVHRESDSDNSVVFISDDSSSSDYKEHRVIHRHKQTSSVRAGGGYHLQAIVSGKAWIKRPNGTTSVYGVGDVLPNGNKVGKIDPNNGVFDSSGRLWISE